MFDTRSIVSRKIKQNGESLQMGQTKILADDKLRGSEGVKCVILQGNRKKVLMAIELKISSGNDGIATVFILKDGQRSRMSVVEAWMKVLDEVESNGAIKGLIITGTDQYFCLGADLDYFATRPAADFEDFENRWRTVLHRVALLPVPTVAAINGHAFGGGAGLAIACDYRVMRSDRGWICFPETVMGLKIAKKDLQLIRLKVGDGNRLRDAVIFSKRLSASEAYAYQLVDVVASTDNLIYEAAKLIKDSLGKHGIDRTSLGLAKRGVTGIGLLQHECDSKL